MPSLLDIAPSDVKSVSVNVRGTDVDVRGLSIGDIAYLIQHFPEVKDMLNGKDVSFDLDQLLTRAPELLYAVIACGTGQRLTAQVHEVIKGLTIEEQTDLMDAILNETFKGGLRPFVARVQHLLGLASDSGIKELASSSRKPSNT